MITDPFLSWYTHKVPLPAAWPTTVQQRMGALGELPNYPKTWVQSSPRMVPGVLPWALLADSATGAQLELFVGQEQQWRGFPGQVPAALAYHPDGGPWLNEYGQPVPVDQWEGGHLTCDQLVVAAHCSAVLPEVRKIAWQQATWLREAVLPTVLQCQVGSLPWLNGNPRAPGWLLRFLVRQLRATPGEPGAMLEGLYVILARLGELATAQGAAGQPWPFYNPAASKQVDHGNLDLCTWMILGPLLSGLCEVRQLAKDADAEAPGVDLLITRCLAHAGRAFDAGTKATGLPGRLADDLDHAQLDAVHVVTPKSYGAMPPWSLAGLADADDQGLLDAQLRSHALELYNGCPFFDTSKPGWGADSKLLGLTLRLAGSWGFRE